MEEANIRSAEVKGIARFLGADLCGIAGVDRFSEALSAKRPVQKGQCLEPAQRKGTGTAQGAGV